MPTKPSTNKTESCGFKRPRQHTTPAISATFGSLSYSTFVEPNAPPPKKTKSTTTRVSLDSDAVCDPLKPKGTALESAPSQRTKSNGTNLLIPPAFGSPSFSVPKFNKSSAKPSKPESSEATAQLDKLFERYRPTSAANNLRCLIKAILDPAWVEEYTQRALYELACFAGGNDKIPAKITQHKSGILTSVRDDNTCLVRAKPVNSGTPYDKTYISYNCDTCQGRGTKIGQQYKWYYHRGFLQAALIGSLLDTKGNNVSLVDALIGGKDASHLCHNSPCSDPFHYVWESDRANLQRNVCRAAALRNRSGHTCTHSPGCRTDLTWREGKGWWGFQFEICVQEAVALSKVGWRCTQGCKVGTNNDKVFRTTEHWRKRGCKKGGSLFRVFESEPEVPDYARYDSNPILSRLPNGQTTLLAAFKK